MSLTCSNETTFHFCASVRHAYAPNLLLQQCVAHCGNKYYERNYMKIKLVAPKMSLRPMDSEFKRLMAPSIALLVLAALTPEEYDVEIIDENVAPIDNYDRVDLVGITCNVDTFEGARIHSLQYQKNGSPVIFGGIFPSSSPQTAGQYATSVCIGDAEPVWHQILKDAQQGNLKKTYRCENEYPAELIPQP